MLELLVPLQTDSARRVAIAADPALRAELVAMAEDSLTWGSSAARVALNQFAGTNYREWLMTDDEAMSDQRAAAPVSDEAAEKADAGLLCVSPNPSTGEVTLRHQLGSAAGLVEIMLYDGWGQPVGRYTPAEGEEALTVHLKPGLYHAQLLAAGKVVAREQVLISR